MCGIAAILDPRGSISAAAVDRVVASLRHRGPDGSAIARSGPATLVHTRLAIIDVEGGDQPLHSEDGSISAIVNGEIYNHVSIRAELRQLGHSFATRSDSEVVVHGYEQWGVGVVGRLNGIFALLIWDAERERLTAARDPYGVKPLYWWSGDDRVIVASEVGALLETEVVEASVDRIALDHYLAFRCVPSPRTLFTGISKLPPAGTLHVGDGGVRVASFRTAPGEPLHGGEEELAEELGVRFRDAVERQMMSDVPYGALLSGGVDSAAVVAAMAARSETPPTTFTVGFPGATAEFDERRGAAVFARGLGADHHATAMGETDFLAQLEDCVPRLEEPCGMPSAPALFQLSRFAAEHVKVVLSGQGADEPHGGYGHHRAAAGLDVLSRMPNALARPIGVFARLFARDDRAERAARLLGDLSRVDRLLRLVEVTDHGLRAELAGSAIDEAEEERRTTAAGIVADVGDRSMLEQALYLDSHLVLPDRLLICADKMSMASSLEQRVPYLDLELMEFVERIPAAMRAGIRRGKTLHRKAVAPLVGEATLARPRHGFTTPYESWLRTGLGAEVERRYAPGAPAAGLIDPAAAARLVAEHRSGRRDHKNTLYCLLELSEWHRAFIDGGST